MASTTRDDAPRANLPLICLIFFLSGVPALIYQLVWQRALFAIYGINVESVTVVVTAFMLGLGLGSLSGGALTRLRKLPLLTTFGIIEVFTGVYGYLSLGIFDGVGEATLGVGTWMTGAITFGLVLVPTVLMGATLPILVAHLVRHTGNVGRAVGLLYFVNTLGSGLACFAVALFLMRTFGMQGVVSIAALINFLVAIGAFAAATRGGPVADSPEDASQARYSRARFLLAAGLVGLTGFIALSYEIVWFRVYSVASGGRAMSFAMLLGSFLVGIALGSLAARRFCGGDPGSRGIRALAWFVLGANAFGFFVAPLTSWGATFTHPFAWLPLVVIAAGMLGATFPLICHYGVAPNARAGAGMSYLYLANIIGAAGGSLLTGFVLMDFLTTAQITVLLAILGLVLAGALSFLADATRVSRLRHVGLAALAGLAVVCVSWPAFDGFWERLHFGAEFESHGEFAHTVENRHGVITVAPDKRIYGGGVYDGAFSTDLVDDVNMIVRPYAMGAFHAAPKDVLMIGLSSGSWAQVVAHHPEVESLTIVEINPGYIELVRKYDEVSSLLDNPKVEIVIDDGRRWLNRNPDRQFDFIMMNTTFHWRAHATNLLSVEFLELVREHLMPGGAAMYNTTGSNRVQRTACMVFPHAVRVINNIVVSDAPLMPDRRRWRRLLEEYEIDGEPVFDLRRADHRSSLQRTLAIIDTIIEDDPGYRALETRASILKRTEGLTLITDDNMGTEWNLHLGAE